MNKDFFPELNPTTLKSYACVWGRRYPIIDKITLYKGVVPDKPYVLVVEIPPDSNPEDPNYIKYLNLWFLGFLPGMPEAREIMKACRTATKDPNKFLSSWIVHKRGISEEHKWSGFDLPDNEIDKIIVPQYAWKLFDKKDSDSILEGHDNAFILKGEYWEITYKGEKIRLRNLERIRYIVHLLDNPNRSFYAHELAQLVKGITPEINQEYSKMSKEQIEKQGMNLTDLDVEDLSQKDQDILEDRAIQQWDELEKAKNSGDSKIIKIKEEEFNRLRIYFANNYSILVYALPTGPKFIKKTRLSKDAEKARSNVSHQIGKALRDFKKNLPTLADYLQKRISRGQKCVYNPTLNNPVDWYIKF